MGGIKGSAIGSTWGYPIESIATGGEGGILPNALKRAL